MSEHTQARTHISARFREKKKKMGVALSLHSITPVLNVIIKRFNFHTFKQTFSV